jgi:hypothetical protein
MILRQYEGKQIRQRDDGRFSLTDMAHATGKRVALYLDNAATEAFLQELSSDVGIPTSLLVETKKGVQSGECPANQGTWAHAQVAMHFAYWASPKLQVHVSRWMLEKLDQAQQGAPITEDRLRELLVETVKAYAGAGQIDMTKSKTVGVRERIHQRCDRASATDCRRIVGRVRHWGEYYKREVFPEGMQQGAPLHMFQEDIWVIDKAIDEVWEEYGINGLPLFYKPTNGNG